MEKKESIHGIEKIALHTKARDLNNRVNINNHPMTENITLNFVPKPKRTITISELIFAYKSCESTLFRVPTWNSKRSCISSFRYVLKYLGITEDQDTRYLGGRHPKTGLVIPKHYLQTNPQGWSRLHVAKSLFSRNMIDWYDEQGIETCHLSHWTNCRVKSVPPQKFIPTTEINLIIEKCEEQKFQNINFYKAYLLGYGLGLRNCEMRRAKWSDLYEDLDGNKCIRIHEPKSGGEFQDRPCDPHYWNRIMEMRDFEDLILSCPENVLKRHFPVFLKEECGVQSRRSVHLLRKYCGHRIMRSNDIYSASKALGHADTKITDQIYSGLPTIRATQAG
jgi:hypothetical protein